MSILGNIMYSLTSPYQELSILHKTYLTVRTPTQCEQLYVCAESETKVVRVEQQRMRTALLDAEMELQKAATAAQNSRRSLQVDPDHI